MKKYIVTAMTFASIACHASTVMGYASCLQWTKETKAAIGIKHDLHELWLLGYLSGANARAPVDFLVGNKSAALLSWVDNYCAANPLDDAPTAAEQLIKTLQARKPN